MELNSTSNEKLYSNHYDISWLTKKIKLNLLSKQNFSINWHLFLLLIATLICFSIFLPFYPGNLGDADILSYWKSVSAIFQIAYWHPPFLQYFWRFLDSPGGVFIYSLTCYWLGLAITAFALFRNIYSSLLFLIVVGFFPANIQFITLMFDDSLILSNLILAFSFIFMYIFRIKKSIFLWLGLLFLFMVNSFKQDMMVYSFLPIVLLSYLILKHYIRYYKIPGLRYTNKKHVLAMIYILLTIVYGSVTYINSKYTINSQVIWKDLISRDLMGTSVYSQKNLFYPYLVKKEFQGKISNQLLYEYIKKEFNPQYNLNAWAAPHTNKYVVDFLNLTTADKVYILNQLASNPVAYLFHRFSVTKTMLFSESNVIDGQYYAIHEWNSLSIENTRGFINKISPILNYLQSKAPTCYFFYLVISILLAISIFRLFVFNIIFNNIERLLIIILAASGLLLFFSLIFLTPAGGQFRYYLPVVYSAEMSGILFLRSFFRYCQRKSIFKLANIFQKHLEFWLKFIYQRLIYLIIFFVIAASVVFITKHNRTALHNHFYILFFNNNLEEGQLKIINFADLTVRDLIAVSRKYNIYLKNNMLIYKKFNCKNNDNAQFFLRINPQNRFNLYWGKLLQGYDNFNFSLKSIVESNNCFSVSYLPSYKMKSLKTGEIRHGKVIWHVNIHFNRKPFTFDLGRTLT